MGLARGTGVGVGAAAVGKGVGVGAAAAGEAAGIGGLIPSARGRRDRSPWQETPLALTQPASRCFVSASSHKSAAL